MKCKILFSLLVLLSATGCIDSGDECNSFAISAEKQLENKEFKGRYHYAIDDYEKAAKCYARAGENQKALEYWDKVVETYILENERELGEGSLASAGKCNFYMAYYSLTELNDSAAAQDYASKAAGYYEQINDSGFKYVCAKAMAGNDASYLDEVDVMVELTGDDDMRKIRNGLREKIQ